MKKDKLHIVSIILLTIVGGLILAELLVHCTRQAPQEMKKQMTMHICNNDTILFDITQVMAIEPSNDDTGYKISYATSDSTFIDMYTSTMEGDYLMYSLDCLAIYEDYNDAEKIDNLTSYFINNSHISYLENPWFTGFTWTWDACPMYRYPNN